MRRGRKADPYSRGLNIHVRLNLEEYDRFQKFAKDNGMSVSDLIRTAVNDYIFRKIRHLK